MQSCGKLAVPPAHCAQTERTFTMNLEEFSVGLCHSFALNAKNANLCMLCQLTVFHFEGESTEKHNRNCSYNNGDTHHSTGRLTQWIAMNLGHPK